MYVFITFANTFDYLMDFLTFISAPNQMLSKKWRGNKIIYLVESHIKWIVRQKQKQRYLQYEIDKIAFVQYYDPGLMKG